MDHIGGQHRRGVLRSDDNMYLPVVLLRAVLYVYDGEISTKSEADLDGTWIQHWSMYSSWICPGGCHGVGSGFASGAWLHISGKNAFHRVLCLPLVTAC